MPRKMTNVGMNEPETDSVILTTSADDESGESQYKATDGQTAGAVGTVVDSAKQAASHMMDQVRDQAATRADEQRQTVASGFASVADAFRQMGDGLREKGEGPVAQYAAELGQAMGGQIEQIGNYLRGRDIRQLVNDTENFARRSPGVFLGGAFLLGLAASRFLKSSPAPDFIRNFPDPNRALPAGAGQRYA